tara:strand:+ start:13249 stop:13770 length:522 start_codon:yes stop_codon:yes gene_type:complete
MLKYVLSIFVLMNALFLSTAQAGEKPAGKTIIHKESGMEIAAVYLQPIDMSPRGMGLSAKASDVHLEADIHAIAGNKNGLGAGAWVPYLTINYTLTNKSNGRTQKGTFMPMVASDGPHYGANVKMLGVGEYQLTFHIDPPSKAGFYRHKDKETGVGAWFKPFNAQYQFRYTGL